MLIFDLLKKLAKIGCFYIVLLLLLLLEHDIRDWGARPVEKMQCSSLVHQWVPYKLEGLCLCAGAPPHAAGGFLFFQPFPLRQADFTAVYPPLSYQLQQFAVVVAVWLSQLEKQMKRWRLTLPTNG